MGPGRWVLLVGGSHYQAIVILGLQVDCSYHVHPYQALLREVLFLRPKQELAGGLGRFRVLRKWVDAEKTLCACQDVGVSSWLCRALQEVPWSKLGREWVV